jgi:hypothetical protein
MTTLREAVDEARDHLRYGWENGDFDAMKWALEVLDKAVSRLVPVDEPPRRIPNPLYPGPRPPVVPVDEPIPLVPGAPYPIPASARPVDDEPRNPEKAHCPTCGTPEAVDLTDGWTQRLTDLYAEWCRGHEAGEREGEAAGRAAERAATDGLREAGDELAERLRYVGEGYLDEAALAAWQAARSSVPSDPKETPDGDA